MYSYQNFKRRANTQPEICILQNKGKRMRAIAKFIINNEDYRYDINVYESDSVECQLNDNIVQNNDIKCEPVTIQANLKKFSVGCKAVKF